jgi:hypothetical protein
LTDSAKNSQSGEPDVLAVRFRQEYREFYLTTGEVGLTTVFKCTEINGSLCPVVRRAAELI